MKKTNEQTSKVLNDFNQNSLASNKVTVYHYARMIDWQFVEDGTSHADWKPGLMASRIGQSYEEAFNTMAVFALLEPLPQEWIFNKDFKNLWENFRCHTGELLLEIEIYPEVDKIFVADRGHMQGYFNYERDGIPKRYSYNTLQEAERAYMKSKIPLAQYLLKAKRLKYSLPEVIILKELVPLERIKISKQQPRLEERLKKFGKFHISYLRVIEASPELSDWYKKYREKEEKSMDSTSKTGVGQSRGSTKIITI